MNNENYLREIVSRGLDDKYNLSDEINLISPLVNRVLDINYNSANDIKNRANKELDIIIKNNYTDYFLLVYDIVHFAKINDIPIGPGRGSAVGSLVLYALGITDIDPIKYGLFFERFIDEERLTMPSIDIDVSYDSKDKIIDYLKSKNIQCEMNKINDIGYLFGLISLDVIKNCIEKVRIDKGVDINLNKISYDDKKIYEMISNGDINGVHQLMSNGITEFIKQLKLDKFSDLFLAISVYRPGPDRNIDELVKRKNDIKSVETIHPIYDNILDESYGVIIYQEQIMEILNKLSGMSLARAGVVRRSLAKKKNNEVIEAKNEFLYGNEIKSIKGCLNNGISENIANKIFDNLLESSAFAFNKSHAVSQAKLAYQMAYLKYYYGDEFTKSLRDVYGEKN